MDLYEYQARDLFEAHGVPVPPGVVASTPAEAEAAARRLGAGLRGPVGVVVKGGHRQINGLHQARL
ncbi:MAG: ATP-grasp domain-containing protein, partial [Peptidiphaga sp.]